MGSSSIHLNDEELLKFCDFLDIAQNTTEHLELEVVSNLDDAQSDLYIDLEEEDEGHRNLVIYSNRFSLILPFETKILENFSQFLRENK